MYMKVCFILLFLVTMCTSCNINKTGNEGDLILNVDFKSPNPVQFDELFSKIELIPLETNDSCLLVSVDKVFLSGEELFVFDQIKPSLFVFDKNGNFKRQISRIGNGPGEYQTISDVFIEKNSIVLLTPFGAMNFYNRSGKFLEKKILPTKPNYFALSHLQNENWVLWSCVEKEEAGISVVDNESMELLYETWHNDRMLDMGLMKPFYTYHDTTYFGSAYLNTVYKVHADSLEVAYQWDFGSSNIDGQKLLSYSKIENANEKNNTILSDLEDGILPYSMEYHNQNKQYYYVALRKGIGLSCPWINVFYRKVDGKSFVFDKIAEGIPVCPIAFTDEYILSVLSLDDIENYRDFLSEENFNKLTLRKGDDNPFLVKFYFK